MREEREQIEKIEIERDRERDIPPSTLTDTQSDWETHEDSLKIVRVDEFLRNELVKAIFWPSFIEF